MADARGPEPLLDEVARVIAAAGAFAEHRVLCEVPARGRSLPVHALVLGNPSPEAAAVGFFGGVHGLERIGTEVVLAFLRQTLARLRWDRGLVHALQDVRLVVVPLVNPGGLLQRTRANPNGVDLMRNAPVECDEGAPALLGGHRVSASLPWYRGREGAAMEPEAAALCELVQSELSSHRFAITVDCHSGFGLTDRLWFPYAHTSRPIEHLADLQALCELLDEALVHHRYVMEPQSRQYLAHGDLWDHLYLEARRADPQAVLLPLTLEMGSWLWVKKNPRQFLRREGLFNPLIEHRQQRVLRRHAQLLDFVLRAAQGHEHWCPRGGDRDRAHAVALERWYGRRTP